MAADLIAAVDETAAAILLHQGAAALGTRTAAGSSPFGPFGAGYTAGGLLSGGVVRLAAPGVVAVDDLVIVYSITLTLSLDLSFLDFCLPRVCIPTPFGDLCTPKICLRFPTLSVPVKFSSSAAVGADFGLSTALTSGDWVVSIGIQQVRTVDVGAAATALLVAIGAAAAAALAAVPFVGPLLALAAGVVGAAFGAASITGLLGTVVDLFLAGLTIEVARRPQTIVLPSGGPNDPAVPFTITTLAAAVRASGENELVLTADL